MMYSGIVQQHHQRQQQQQQHHHHHHQQNNLPSSSEKSRLAVADILSSMAVGGEAITPSTFAALEGFSTGVLTQTTPTLTPTTLRSIEQTFIELQAVPPPTHSLVRHHNEAGFVPPVVSVPSSASMSMSIGGIDQRPSSATTIAATTTTASSSSSSSVSDSCPSSSSAAFLGLHGGSTSVVTTYQTLTTRSVASVDGDGNGMSSSASSSGSSTTSASDLMNDGWPSGGGGGGLGGTGRGRTSDSQPTTASRGGAKGRNMGGRRPAKYEKLTPEEEERRRVRRERNKLAAARCRKRRMDHTNSLIYETEGLEDQRSSLQSEIQDLQSQKDELEFILEAHKVVCKLQRQTVQQHCHQEQIRGRQHECIREEDDGQQPEQQQQQQQQQQEPMDIKPDVSQLNVAIQQQQLQGNAKRSRPNSLALSSTFVVPRVGAHHQQQQLPPTTVTTSASSTSGRMSLTEATGISISTPSNGIFNFEALMEGGTGLTPVSCSGGGIGGIGLTPISMPTCSTQLRSSGGSDCLSSPEGNSVNGPPKLVSL